MNTNTQKSPRPSATLERSNRTLAGLRRLQATQQPGECFTPAQIARECECHERAIVFIERKALFRLAQRLRAAAPGVFEELSPDASVKAIFARLAVDPEKTGKPFRRPASARKERRVERINVGELIETFAGPRGVSRGFGVPISRVA